MGTPVDDGLYMPAEWQAHARCWMAWPCHVKIWGDGLEAARHAYAEVAKAIARFEPVTMVAPPEFVADASVQCGGGVDIMPAEIDDSWLRDNGPTFVVDGRGGVAGVHWRFNAWGNNYKHYERDAALGATILERLKMRRYAGPMILEGGSINVDGEGTLLTTEQCLLNPNRNPSLDRERIEQHLTRYLGVRKVIWLGQGLEDDETDGHVDNLACFVRPGVVLALVSDDRDDGNYALLQENLATLRASTDAAGRTLEVIEVPQPKRREARGVRMGLSYVNLYIANDGVVMPAFEDAGDDKAHDIVAKAFSDRRVVQVPASDIVFGGGGIHCITQQQPVGEPLPPAAGAA